jgi:hypothetical protein
MTSEDRADDRGAAARPAPRRVSAFEILRAIALLVLEAFKEWRRDNALELGGRRRQPADLGNPRDAVRHRHAGVRSTAPGQGCIEESG